VDEEHGASWRWQPKEKDDDGMSRQGCARACALQRGKCGNCERSQQIITQRVRVLLIEKISLSGVWPRASIYPAAKTFFARES